MKIKKYSAICVAAIMLGGLASCEKDEPQKGNFETLNPTTENGFKYSDTGVWENVALNGQYAIGNFLLSHRVDDFGAYKAVYGFIPSRSTDMTNYPGEMYNHAYTSIAGLYNGKTPYLIAAWNGMENHKTPLQERSLLILDQVEGSTFEPLGMSISNNTYAYYAMTVGDSYAKPFGDGSWFTVTAHGVKTDGTETTLTFDLARCSAADPKAGVLNTWQAVDLSPLGLVSAVYFTLDSSDSGQWGMNTPAYFAIADLRIRN